MKVQKSSFHNKGFEFCTIKGRGQNLTQPIKIVNNMPFNDVGIYIGFTFKSWSKLSLENDTLNQSPCMIKTPRWTSRTTSSASTLLLLLLSVMMMVFANFDSPPRR